MKVYRERFRPAIAKGTWREVVGCSHVAVILPLSVGAAIAFLLPRNSSAPEEWWTGLKRGLVVGILVYTLCMLFLSLVRQWFQNRAEALETAMASKEVLEACCGEAEQARINAIHGSEWIDQAEKFYWAPEYIPFWEAVENAEIYLKRCCEILARIHARRLEYAKLLGGRSHSFPDLDERLGALYDPRPDMLRLKQLIRLANGNPTFAMIQAQKATTEAVKEGFGQLVVAIQHLEKSVTESLNDLKESVVTEIKKSTSIQTQILKGVQLIATMEQRQVRIKREEEAWPQRHLEAAPQ